jgi:hypothetical protein
LLIVQRDLPIPAPANWPRTAPPPTDKPVLRNELWYASRQIQHASWHVVVFGDATSLDVLARQAFVVDDFGSLQPVDDSFGSANHEFFWSTWCIDAAACDWIEEQCAAGEHARRQERLAQRTRALLRPQPVTVEIITEPAHPQCVASIVLGDDPRSDAPTYSVHAPHSDPLLLTHAQLCALALAANQLVKASKPTGRPQ